MSNTYVAGKRQLKLEDVGHDKDPSYREIFVANESHDKKNNKRARFDNMDLRNVTFLNMSFKEADFNDINFSYCIFVNCYFRGASFKNCNLTGAKFIDCNFRSASLANTNLSYSQWNNTSIERNNVLANLPAYGNIAQELLITMRLNAASIGEYEDARQYIYESERQSRRYNLSKVKGATDYFKNKYTLDQRIIALIKYMRSHIERLIWGYGEKVLNVLITAIIIIIVFSLFYFLREQSMFMGQGDVISGLCSALMLSASVFASFNLTEVDEGLQERLYSYFLAEALLGIVFIGFLAASLHRRISMRRD